MDAVAKPKTEYRRSLDLARFIAAFGIVWDHARAPYADIGYTALSLFLILASFLAMGSFERSGKPGFWSSRAKRIALPWLFWCIVYRLIYEIISDKPFALLSEPFSILIGPSIHLWFLPFDMIALLLIPVFSSWIRSERELILSCILLVAVAIPLGWLHAQVGLEGWFNSMAKAPQPLPQWYFSLPIFMYGAFAAAGHRLGKPLYPLFAALVVSGALLIIQPGFASVQMFLTALIFEALWRFKIVGTWPTKLASYAFGIYLMHPAFMLVAFKLFGADVDRSYAALFTFFSAWAATWVFQHIPFLNRMA